MKQQYSQIKDLNGHTIKIIEKGDSFFIGRHGSVKMSVGIEQLELILQICNDYAKNRKTSNQANKSSTKDAYKDGVTWLACPCLRRIKQRDTDIGRIFKSAMQLCPTCGNKRCQKGTNHDLDCSGSNLPGQYGSSYE